MKRILILLTIGILLIGGLAVADVLTVSRIDKNIEVSKTESDIMGCMGYGNLTITEYQLPEGKIKRCIEELELCEIFDVLALESERDAWEKEEIKEHASLFIKRGYECEVKVAEGITTITEERK